MKLLLLASLLLACTPSPEQQEKGIVYMADAKDLLIRSGARRSQVACENRGYWATCAAVIDGTIVKVRCDKDGCTLESACD